MKRVTGTAYYFEANESEEPVHTGILMWVSRVHEIIAELLDDGKPIDMDVILSRAFQEDVAKQFSKADLVKLMESTLKKRTPRTHSVILSELMIRFSEKESSIKHFVARQDTDDLGLCLDLLISKEKFETACYIRDEINRRTK